MIDLNNTFKKKVLGVTLAIMAIAFVVSTGSKVLAQSTVDVEADTSIAVGDAVANASDVSAESGHGLDRVIKGTEKWGEEHNIDQNGAKSITSTRSNSFRISVNQLVFIRFSTRRELSQTQQVSNQSSKKPVKSTGVQLLAGSHLS